MAKKKKKLIKHRPKKKTIKKKTRMIKKARKVKKTKRSGKVLFRKKLKRKIFRKVKRTRHKKISNQLRQENDLLAKSFFRAKIKVIGIGGGGGSIVSEISRSLEKAKFVVADTDARNFKKRAGIKYFLFGQKLTHGLGTGMNTTLAKMAAEQEKERISKLFEGDDMVIFVSSLGGGVGSGSTPIFSEISKGFNGISFGIFTLPFKFEGKNKHKIALKSLQQLRKSLNVSLTISNERIFKIIDSSTTITEAFSIINKNLVESLESLIDLIYNPGIINIDFADLKAVLGGKGNSAFLNTAEASGKDRVKKIIQEILHNPLYQNNNFVAQRVLFNVQGSGSLSMLEVDEISRAITAQNPKAKIIFGVSKNLKYKNKIKTTLLMTGEPIVVQEVTKKVKVQEMPKIKAKVKAKLKVKNKVKKNKRSVATKKEEKVSLPETLTPVFNNIPVAADNLSKLTVIEEPKNYKKTIRRTALEIKEAQEIEEKKKSQQEKEWEIPAFLRKVKFK